jgi:hypothetical protein
MPFMRFNDAPTLPWSSVSCRARTLLTRCWLFQCDLERLLVSTGGKDRGESVWSGLEDLPDELTVAVIHDAAARSSPAPRSMRSSPRRARATGPSPRCPWRTR